MSIKEAREELLIPVKNSCSVIQQGVCQPFVFVFYPINHGPNTMPSTKAVNKIGINDVASKLLMVSQEIRTWLDLVAVLVRSTRRRSRYSYSFVVPTCEEGYIRHYSGI